MNIETTGSKKKGLKSFTAISFALAMIFGAQPMAAQAAEGSAVGFSSVSLMYRSASVSTGVNQYNSSQPTKTYQWYKCTTNTEFIAMVPAPTAFEGALVVVNSEADIEQNLTDAGCVALSGKVDESMSITELYNTDGTLKDASKPFVTVTTLVTPPVTITQLPHSAIATGAYLRTSTSPIPGMEKVGAEHVSTDPIFVDGSGDYEISPTYYSWYACDEAVEEGFNLHEWFNTDINISDTPVANCQKLFSAWEEVEGWMGTELAGLTLDPAAEPIYTTDPADAYSPLLVNGVPAPIDLDGKYIVRTINAYPYFGWSNGVLVGADPVTEPENPEEELGPGTEESETVTKNLADTGSSTEIQLFVALLSLLAGLGLVSYSRRRSNV